MSDDFRVGSLSNADTRAIAKKLREYFGVASDRCIDVLECAKRPTVWTVNGERILNLEVRPDTEMPNAHGVTTELDGVVTIRVRQSVRYGAYMGDGRDRNTYAHEFGHAALGHAAHVRGAELARRPLTNVTPMDDTIVELYKTFKRREYSFESWAQMIDFSKDRDYHDVRGFLNVCELLAMGVHEKAFSRRVAKAYWGDVLPDTYYAAKPLIDRIRRTRGEGSRETYVDLEKLARDWRAGLD